MKRKSLFVAVLAVLPLCALAQQEQAKEGPRNPTTGEQAHLPEWKAAEHDANAAAAGGDSSATTPKVGPAQSSSERTADPTAYTGQHDAPTGETPPAVKPKPPDAKPAPGCADRSAC